MWGHDAEWLLECPFQMKQHFAEEKAGAKPKDPVLTPAQLQTKWKKMPAAIVSSIEEPSTSSVTAQQLKPSPEGRGMAGAAFPEPISEPSQKSEPRNTSTQRKSEIRWGELYDET